MSYQPKYKAPAPEWVPMLDDSEYKHFMYETLADMIHFHTGGRRLGKLVARDLFEAMIELMFKQAIAGGYFRFPLGYGALKVRKFKAAAKAKIMPTRADLPTAPVAKPGERQHLRYTEGTSVRHALGTYTLPYKRKTKRRSRLDPTVVVLDAPPV